MRLWNGWGNENSDLLMELNSGLRNLLQALVGPATPLGEATLEQVMAKVPASRAPAHPLIDTDAETRVRHARGQSLPDWLAMHSGDVDSFPDAVAVPENSQQVRELLLYARDNGLDVIPYGGGTSVVGHINPEISPRPILTIDMSAMNQLIHFDRDSQLATFGAGTAGPELEAQLQKEGYTLGHFPQSWELSTVGGWVASRSSGQQSLHYGRIENMFAGGSIETLAGTLEIPTIPASSAGPDIREMILGSEGRMGIITEVVVRVTKLPEAESFQVMFFPSWEIGLKAARELIQQRIALSMVRLSNPLETTSLLYMGAGDDSSGVIALETALAEKGIGAGKVMMTFGVTGSARHCDVAKEMALDLCISLGAVADQAGLGDKWAHGRFRAPYLRDPLGSAGYAVDTMETAVDWSSCPRQWRISNRRSAMAWPMRASRFTPTPTSVMSMVRVRVSTPPIYSASATAMGRPWSAGTSSRRPVPSKLLPVAALLVTSTVWVAITATIWSPRKALWVWQRSILCASYLIPRAR